MVAMQVPFDSDALRANIDSTAQQVVIPERYLVLIEAVEGLHGVRSSLEELLGEYFHRFRNIDVLVEGLQTTLLRNWPYFERSEQRARLFDLLAELVLGLFEAPLKEEQFTPLLRALFVWSTQALGGRYGDAYDDTLERLVVPLHGLMPGHLKTFLERDVLLRNLVMRAAERPSLASAYNGLYREFLTRGYRYLREFLDLPGWARSTDQLTDGESVAERFSFLEREWLDALVEGVADAPFEVVLSHEYPLPSELLERTTEEVRKVEDLEDRFGVCLFLVKDEALGYRQKEVMVDLLDVVKELMRSGSHTHAERVLSRLTTFFRAHPGEFLLVRFQCYEAVGVAIGEAANVRAADHLIEDILYWDFEYPDIRGATDEWETVVNPYHLPKIRCWLHIIESNPALFERLAAALNLQLRLGGVYIADTDLFQRDVTRFLNADIQPIYFIAKQLLRTFPVYFGEIGAEGELRAVSTEIDEVCGRRDSLMHFLRKQVHAESSNRLVAFSREVLRYWRTLDPSGLEPYLSANAMENVRGERGWAEGPHEVLAALCEAMTGRRSAAGRPAKRGESAASILDAELDRILTSSVEELTERIAGLSIEHPAGERAPGQDEIDRRRVVLLVRNHQLLTQKYSLSADDLSDAVNKHLQLDVAVRRQFERALALWRVRPRRAARDRLIDASLAVLESLKAIILSPAQSAAVESLYQKRHIAAGIPSMYGNYSEPKFDALGLSFRVEQLVSRLLEDVVVEGIEPYVTRASLRRMAETIARFERALWADGIDSRALMSNLKLLQSSFSSHNFTFGQYQNVFQFLASSVTEVSSTSILSHEQVLHTMLSHDPRQCQVRGMTEDAVAEMILREVLVSALGMQALDRYVAAALHEISTLTGQLDAHGLTRMMNYDPERLISPIHRSKPGVDDQRTLGFKGLGLKQMSAYGHKVPEGFVLSTELSQVHPALSYEPLYDDMLRRIRRSLVRLERQTGLRLGDPSRALFLSIRSGAAISMPGLMTTFVNAGINDEIATGMATRPGFGWSSWDSYRRFLQSWAMADGVDRDAFDAIMGEAKERYGVAKKRDFTAEQMRELAFDYKQCALDSGVKLIDDPFAQVVACIFKVLDSWDSEHAKLYRSYIGVAEEWGTAVVVQRMVFGNLSEGSGSGVTFTHNPLEPYSRQVRLFGDFAVCAQGEDLVGGLVFPLPISEAQRRGSPTYREVKRSLERDYPAVYGRLLEIARELVSEHEYDPQEIEFTFESPSADDLYILQKRAVVHEQKKEILYFDTSSPAYGPAVAMGIGVAGSAYSGRVAVSAEQIDRLLEENPDELIVLLRPDTVPEDIAMITRVSGILTGRGGATSHAAVTAKRLGKTAVVDCVDLEVNERRGTAKVAGHKLRVGDWLSIDGRTGNIFLGHIPMHQRPLSSRPSGGA